MLQSTAPIGLLFHGRALAQPQQPLHPCKTICQVDRSVATGVLHYPARANLCRHRTLVNWPQHYKPATPKPLNNNKDPSNLETPRKLHTPASKTQQHKQQLPGATHQMPQWVEERPVFRGPAFASKAGTALLQPRLSTQQRTRLLGHKTQRQRDALIAQAQPTGGDVDGAARRPVWHDAGRASRNESGPHWEGLTQSEARKSTAETAGVWGCHSPSCTSAGTPSHSREMRHPHPRAHAHSTTNQSQACSRCAKLGGRHRHAITHT
jgi:hypothetical protein